MTRVLVTGGAGYIGSHVVRRLAEGGAVPVVLDDLSTGRPSSVDEAARLRIGDIGDRRDVERILRDERIDAVIHVAGIKSVAESIADPARYVRTNVVGSLSLLEACVAAGVSNFVFSSSAAVYGTPMRLPVREADPASPENPYGETKLAVERIIHWFGRAHGLRAVSLRYFNAAGASADGTIGEPWDRATNLIPVVLRAAWDGKTVDVFGDDYPTDDGTAVRDYVHVTDLADAHALALERLGELGGTPVLNLGTGRGASVRDVIETARAVTGRPIAVRTVERRPGDPAAVWADTTLARERLGWVPRSGLRDMVESAWAWHTRGAGRPLIA